MSAVMPAGTGRNSPDNRAFAYAVIASILIHGALLFALPGAREAKYASKPGPIIARLMQPQVAAEPAGSPPQAEPQPPRIEPAPPPPPVAKPVPAPSPVAKAKPQVPAAPAATPPPQAAAAPAPEPPASTVAPPSGAPAPGPLAKTDPQATAPAPAEQSADGIDFASIRKYTFEVAALARKFKRYPRAAMDNNWQGKVVIRIVVPPNGVNARYSILESSGHELLDKQALDMVSKARPRAEIPPLLRGKEFSFEIPVIFDLRDPNA